MIGKVVRAVEDVRRVGVQLVQKHLADNGGRGLKGLARAVPYGCNHGGSSYS